MIDLQPGDIVLTTRSRTRDLLLMPITAARVMEPIANSRWWLDCNVMGVRIPQMYNADEIELATPALAEQYELCAECLGYGRLDRYPQVLCAFCNGSGSAKYLVTITEDAGGMRAQVTER